MDNNVMFILRRFSGRISQTQKVYLTMLFNQVQVDFRTRYLGTMLGFLWAILNPLLYTAIYSFVIVFVFRARLSPDSTPLDYVVFILSGLIPWLAFQEGVLYAMNSIVANSNIVKNLPFPLEIFPLSGAITSLVTLSVGLVLALVVLLLSGRPFSWVILTLPFLMLIQLYFTLGFGFFLASLSVFVRDVSQTFTYVMMLILYLSPVVYDISMLPLPILKTLSYFNPVYYFIAMYRDILYYNQPPQLAGILALIIFSSISLWFGLRFFRRTKPFFSDYLA